MDELEKLEFITEDGTPQEFYIVDEAALNGCKYILVTDLPPEMEGALAYIFKEISEDGEETLYEPVEDEREQAALLVLFNESLSEEGISLE